MIIETKKVTLPKGTLTMCSPTEKDAQEILDATIKMAGESKFLSGSPESRSIPLEEEIEWVKRERESADRILIAAFFQPLNSSSLPTYAGNLEVRLNTKTRQTHRGNVGIALLKDYTHLGIGTELFKYAKELSKQNNLELLELEVVSTNLPAINCYAKQGFYITGTRPHALKYEDNTYADMYCMQCQL